MRCRTAHKLLSSRLDRRLSPTDERVLEVHLASCPACALAAGRLVRAWGRLEALRVAAEAPDDFGAVLGAVASRRPRTLRWLGWVEALVPERRARPVWAAAVAASLLVGGVAGVRLGRAAFDGRSRSAPPEALALDDGFGVLPFGLPAAGLTRVLGSGAEARE